MANYQIQSGNNLPVIQQTLSDANGPIDLSGVSSVSLRFRKKNSATWQTKTGEVAGALVGLVKYAWTNTADVPEVGEYYYHWKIDYVSGDVLSVPNTELAEFEVLGNQGL